MNVITSKESNSIFAIGLIKEYWSNGYPIVEDESGFKCAYPINMVNVYGVDEVPEAVIPHKYCYTPESGFYENPNYIEPVGTEGSEQDVVDSIMQEVSSYGY